MAHTPGPWKADDLSVRAMFEGQEVNVASVGGTQWGYPDGGKNRRFREQGPHNVALIASAPELLAALEAVEWVWREDKGWSFCPSCYAIETGRGHAPNCQLAAALAKAKAA